MIYVVRNRYKESMKPKDFAKVNRLIDEGIIPAMEEIKGVRSVRAFNSFGGEIIMLVEIEELAAIDRALVDKEYSRIASGMFDYMIRVGGDVWFDRESWENCYGHKARRLLGSKKGWKAG
jgi:hypothetical protein